jgi:uncharacterized repeat protein (TIGR01451 family)
VRKLVSRFLRVLAIGRRRRPGVPLKLVELESRCLPSGLITGVVYEDFNGNGVRDLNVTLPTASEVGTVGLANDPGVGGVTVTAVDDAGNVDGVTTSTANGSYALNVGGTGPYRIDFSTLPAGFSPGPHGPQNGTTEQFVPDGNSAGIDLGLTEAADFSQDNPPLVTQQYVFGDQLTGPNANQPVLVSFPYNSGASDTSLDPNSYTVPTTHALAVTANQIGTTFGLAYDNLTQTIYASAYTKKFAGYGPDGNGAIYMMGPTGTTATLFADLNQIFGPDTAGANFRDTPTWVSQGGFTADGFNTGWDAVGKTGLGGMAISTDGSTLYVMNLADDMLYILPTSGPLNSTTVQRVAVPNPITSANSNDPTLDFRPFAVEYHGGKVYVGAVNSAESTQNAANLEAYVFVFDPTTNTFNPTPIFQFSLDYPRGNANAFPGTDSVSAAWNPWTPVFKNLSTATTGVLDTIYPQPMFTSMAFDTNGDLVIGLRDRAGDQTGVFTPDDPSQPNTLRRGISAGDTLRAAFDPTTGTFTLENNGSVGGNTSAGANNGEGPGGGEFYFQDNQPFDNSNRNGPGNHDAVAVGGVAQIPGYPNVAVTTFNPARLANLFNRGGVRLFNNTTGKTDAAYELYDTTTNIGQTFAKANGVGDLIALSNAAPVEIGNRVWLDTNHNGIQDADEPGIGGVTVRLYAPDGTLLATAVTDDDGNYYFSNGPGTSTASSIFNIAGLTDNTSGFTIRLDNPADYEPGGPLAGLDPTIVNAGTNPAIDSKGVAFSPTDVRAAVAVGGPGENDHTFDFGFVQPVADLQLLKSVNNPTPNLGDTITFTVTLNNLGPDQATGVVVRDTLPPGLAFVNSSVSQGAFDPATGLWNVGAVASGGTATLQIQATVQAGGIRFNFAQIVASDQPDPDETNNQDQAGVDVNTPQHADLQLTKTLDTPPNGAGKFSAGDVVTFTVHLTNHGPDDATDVVVLDQLSEGLTFVSATPSQGAFDPTTGLWTVGTLANGATATLQVSARIEKVGNLQFFPSSVTLSNSAVVQTSDEFDPNPDDDQAEVPVPVVPTADLSIAKTVSNPTPQVGSTITYTISLSNLGPDEATGVVVNDGLPSGLTFVSATVSEGTYDPTSGTWEVSQIAPGHTQTLTITALVASHRGQVNTAAVTHSDQFDPNLANNSASVTEVPVLTAVQIGKFLFLASTPLDDGISPT